MNTAAEATILTDLLDRKVKAIAKIKAEAQQAIDSLKSKLAEMENALKAQQGNIGQLNGGNDVEKQKFADLTKAYNQYQQDLKSIGVVDKGNGNFDIPKGAEGKFNDITLAYQGKVNEFNNYLNGRSNQINQYNAATTDYNQKVAALNSIISDLVNKYQLSDYMKKQNGINIPFLTPAEGRNPPGQILLHLLLPLRMKLIISLPMAPLAFPRCQVSHTPESTSFSQEFMMLFIP